MMDPMTMMMLLQAGMGMFNSMGGSSGSNGGSGQAGTSQSIVGGAGKDSGGSAIPNLLGGGGGVGGALSGAATGASIGSVIPGIGTGIGALVGGGLGLLGGGGGSKKPKPVIYPIGTKENPGYVNTSRGGGMAGTQEGPYGKAGEPQYADQGAMNALLGSQMFGQGAQVGSQIGDMFKKRTPSSSGGIGDTAPPIDQMPPTMGRSTPFYSPTFY